MSTHNATDMEFDEERIDSSATPAELSFFSSYDSEDEIAEENASSFSALFATSSRSMAGTIWEITDLDYEINERFKGPTMDSYRKDYKDYVAAIKSLPTYHADAIREEIGDWDLSVPSVDEFHYNVIQEVYARMVSYRNRLTYLQDLVNAHYELLSDAIKSLKLLAIKLTTGTKHDKEATATNLVQPLIKALPEISRLKTNLEGVSRNVDFNALQMDRLMRERQSIAKINQGHVSEGMGHTYSREQAIDSGEEGASSLRPSGYKQKSSNSIRPSKPIVKTRNHRLKD